MMKKKNNPKPNPNQSPFLTIKHSCVNSCSNFFQTDDNWK